MQCEPFLRLQLKVVQPELPAAADLRVLGEQLRVSGLLAGSGLRGGDSARAGVGLALVGRLALRERLRARELLALLVSRARVDAREEQCPVVATALGVSAPRNCLTS